MAITVTTTGSQWVALVGTNEELVNYMMTSGIGAGQVVGTSASTAGSITLLYNR